jgi:hypothetical protein
MSYLGLGERGSAIEEYKTLRGLNQGLTLTGFLTSFMNEDIGAMQPGGNDG